jgi:hypothetical protein
MDVAKVDHDVAYIEMVVHVCCKRMFPMFHLFLYLCCKCVYLDVAYISVDAKNVVMRATQSKPDDPLSFNAGLVGSDRKPERRASQFDLQLTRERKLISNTRRNMSVLLQTVLNMRL